MEIKAMVIKDYFMVKKYLLSIGNVDYSEGTPSSLIRYKQVAHDLAL
jgi:hypothetical protein